MITYTVWYKHWRESRWHKIKDVKGDAGSDGFKIIILADETQYHFPADKYAFKYSKERFVSIKQRMESEAGQSIPLNRR